MECVPKIFYAKMLGLSGLPDVPLEEAEAALRQYRAALVERRDQVQANWDRQRPLPGSVDALFDYSVTMIQAEATWVEQFIAKMEAQHGQD